LISKNGAQRLQKTYEDLFLEVMPKKRLHYLSGRKFVGKSGAKTFRASLGKIRQKSFSPQKFACYYTYVVGHTNFLPTIPFHLLFTVACRDLVMPGVTA